VPVPTSAVRLAITAALGLLANMAAQAEDTPRPEHPRPDFQRDTWANLNGTWQFRFDPKNQGVEQHWFASGASFDRRIVVPFCWESPLSGIGDTSGQRVGWYRRKITMPEAWQGKQVWLCFGAVDWQCRVWIDGREVGQHEGGYSPFEFDITEWVSPGASATLVVRAEDPTDRELPTGKQIGWYTPTSGIWQTVYLEARPATHIDHLRMVPIRRGSHWLLEVHAEAVGPDGSAELQIISSDAGVSPYRGALKLSDGRGELSTLLEITNARPWTPETPHLYDLEARLHTDGGTDVVRTYFGLRTIGRGRWGDLPHEAILLNGEPVYLRGALDQSFNPQGIHTAPSDAFLRRDMEIAKEYGLNFLRIHIKSEEPRRLYWADRLGVLLMEDMPCTWEQSPRARAAWEPTMRATIRRDINHPSIIAWCLFNETWGLGRNYKTDVETQQWVERLFDEVRKRLDPSRLVEDNSPCRYDHVKTDLNSWHFYIDDDKRAREHIEHVVENTYPGSSFNYVPGRVQGTEPLINSEYGAVSAGGGDRDISWGFRSLTTELRRHEKIQGYVYTELSDIEWEHNGLVDYDRSAKEFGYDAFVPEMTVAELNGADFVGYDCPPLLEAAPGDRISVPVFVSHFSDRTGPARLRWHIGGTNDLGQTVRTPPRTRAVIWNRCRVTFQPPLEVTLPGDRPFVGAVALELLDEHGERIAANFVNLIVRHAPVAAVGRVADMPESPRIEVIGERLVAVRFAPQEFSAMRADAKPKDAKEHDGKIYAPGDCEVEYRLTLPDFVCNAAPTQLVLLAELSSKADDERLDWPSRRQPLDYPQTQARKHPGKVVVELAGRTLWELALPDDPADARGVLSHHARFHHGSYGYLVRRKVDLAEQPELRDVVTRQVVLPLVFRTVDGHGLSIYGRQLGRYPIDPTLIIQTAKPLSQPVGAKSLEPVTEALEK